MTQSTGAKKNLVAIITMFCIFAMISFVTNMAAPFGNIWGFKYSWAGMLGNLMNFAAYLFMGIPAGKMLSTIGYKKTTLYALLVGFVGLLIQYLSSIIGADVVVFTTEAAPVTLNLFIYLLGAFICGFCVCMLNTVVNPMLNILGGGGNKGNQLIQTGATLNSLTGSLTPLFVGVLIGTVSPKTTMGNVAPLLFVGMGVFLIAFLIISRLQIPEPAVERAKAAKAAGIDKVKYEYSPWRFLHFVLGAFGIFFYVGIEIGIPGELNFYLSDASSRGAGILVNGAAIAGAIVMIYWLLMLVGRAVGSAISGAVSARLQMAVVSSVGALLVATAIFMPKSATFNVPSFIYNPEKRTVGILESVGMPQDGIKEFIANPTEFDWSKYEAFTNAEGETVNLVEQLHQESNVTPEDAPKMLDTPVVPISALLLILCGLCTSVMWGNIFNLSVEGLGKYTEQASGIFMMLVVGGGIMPVVQHNILAPWVGYMGSYWLVFAMLVYLLYYALIGCKNVNKDIPV